MYCIDKKHRLYLIQLMKFFHVINEINIKHQYNPAMHEYPWI